MAGGRLFRDPPGVEKFLRCYLLEGENLFSGGTAGILVYLVQSSKIILNDHEIVWVFPDKPALKKALSKSVRLR